MSRKYLPVNREKPMFLPLDMQSWVAKDHLAWFLVDVVRQLDTSALEAGTSPGKGRPGYDPQMLVTLVMYAMACGERSSRPPPLAAAERTIRSTSWPSRRPATVRFTSGNTSHGGTLPGTPGLRGTRQRLRAPRTSLASPGLGLAQPPGHRDRSQQAINPYDRDIPAGYSVYVCISACSLSTPTGSPSTPWAGIAPPCATRSRSPAGPG